MTQSSGCRERGETVCARVFFPPLQTQSCCLFLSVCVCVCLSMCVWVSQRTKECGQSLLYVLCLFLHTAHILKSACRQTSSPYFVCSCRPTPPCCLSVVIRPLILLLLFLFFCLSTATRGGHHSVLCGSTGAGRAGWHVLQQLLPLPDIRPGPGSEQCYEPVGAERAPGRREVSGHTGPLMDRRRRGRGGQLAKEESERKQLMFRQVWTNCKSCQTMEAHLDMSHHYSV